MPPNATRRSASAEAGSGVSTGSSTRVGEVRVSNVEGSVEEGGSNREAFMALEVVVGRGVHSKQGVARLRPAVARHLAGRGFRAREKGEGVVVVSLQDVG